MTMLAASSKPYSWLKPGVLVGGLVPLFAIGFAGVRGKLGANPVAEALNDFGLLALVFLVASLAATPLKRLLGYTWPMRLRRMLGLFAFFYATLHLLTYVALDRAGEFATIVEDLVERPFITVGMLAWLLLLPLALTSRRSSIKQLGFKNWQRLHRLSYVVALLAIVHFLYRVKRDTSEPVAYGAIVLVLLGIRVFYWYGTRKKRV